MIAYFLPVLVGSGWHRDADGFALVEQGHGLGQCWLVWALLFARNRRAVDP